MSSPESPSSRSVVTWLPPALLLGAGLAVWEVWTRLADTPAWLLPPPSDIGRSLVADRRLLLHHAWITLQEVVIGFLIAVAAGILLAVLLERSALLRRALYPLIVGSQAIPIVALAPLLLVWFGYGLFPKVLITALVAFFPIVVSSFDGLRSADREQLDLLRAMGASDWARFRLVKAPSALPSLFSGMRVGIAVAVIGAVFGEYAGSKAGLGYLMNVSSGRLLTDRVFACITLLGVMAIALFGLVVVFERLVLPWRGHQVGGETG